MNYKAFIFSKLCCAFALSLSCAEEPHHYLKTSMITVDYGISAKTGTRHPVSEDTYSIDNGDYERLAFFAVFDGHEGNNVSIYLRDKLISFLKANLKLPDFNQETIKTRLSELIKEADKDILSKFETGGSCAIIALVDKVAKKLYIANLGDSRAVLVRPGMDPLTRQLSTDHKASNPVERERIEKSGGIILMNRIWGTLAVSRSFGDKTTKRVKITKVKEVDLSPMMSEPEITIRDLKSYDQFLILACDGLWDKLSNEDAGKIVQSRKPTESLNQTADYLARESVAKGSADDITAIIIRFHYP